VPVSPVHIERPRARAPEPRPRGAAVSAPRPDPKLNDGAKAFVPGGDPDRRPLPDVPGIEITIASPRQLLAMKLMAMRFGEDEEDIEFLLGEAGVESSDEALALLERLGPTREPPRKTRLYLEESSAPARTRRSQARAPCAPSRPARREGVLSMIRPVDT